MATKAAVAVLHMGNRAHQQDLHRATITMALRTLLCTVLPSAADMMATSRPSVALNMIVMTVEEASGAPDHHQHNPHLHYHHLQSNASNVIMGCNSGLMRPSHGPESVACTGG